MRSAILAPMGWSKLANVVSHAAACALLLSGCAGDGDAFDDTSPPGKADVFGEDDRNELYHYELDSTFGLAAQATGALMLPGYAEALANSRRRLSVDSYGDAYGLCSDVRFHEQPSVPGACSAFLVGDDLVMTAGHCLYHSSSCSDYQVVFDYSYDRAPADPYLFSISNDDVYNCVEVVAVGSESCTDDYALLRLDRPVVDRTPLVIAEAPAIDEEIFLAGHPSGLPMKLSTGNIRAIDDIIAHTDADAFGGNSGSPAINAETGEVFGIHVCSHPGNFDYDYDSACYRPIDCGPNRETCERWAEAFKLTNVLDLVKPHLE